MCLNASLFVVNVTNKKND